MRRKYPSMLSRLLVGARLRLEWMRSEEVQAGSSVLTIGPCWQPHWNASTIERENRWPMTMSHWRHATLWLAELWDLTCLDRSPNQTEPQIRRNPKSDRIPKSLVCPVWARLGKISDCFGNDEFIETGGLLLGVLDRPQIPYSNHPLKQEHC